MITNNHIINDDFLNQGNKQITIETLDEQKTIILNKQDRKFFSIL